MAAAYLGRTLDALKRALELDPKDKAAKEALREAGFNEFLARRPTLYLIVCALVPNWLRACCEQANLFVESTS